MIPTWIWHCIVGFGGGVAGGILFLLVRPARRRNSPGEIPRRDHAQTTFVFSGNLKQTGLLDAVQFLEIGRRQGILHIYCGRRKGYLTFVEGKVVDAFYRNHTGREAIVDMLELEEGDFYFEPKTVVAPRLIAESIVDLAFALESRKGT